MNPQMDLERARFNMDEQQIRPWEVLDQRVLDLLFKLRREDFVPPAYRELAFADMEIPLGYGEKMLQPKLEARMVQDMEASSLVDPYHWQFRPLGTRVLEEIFYRMRRLL